MLRVAGASTVAAVAGRDWGKRLTLAALLVGGVAGCGVSGASPSTDVRVVAAAPAGMAKVASCKMAATFSGQSEQGVIDFAHHRAMLTARVALPGQPPSQSVEVFEGSTRYVKGLAGPSNPSKPWTAIPLSGKLANLNIGNMDPVASLSVMSQRGPVEVIGEETVRGVRTTHFRQHLPLGGKPAQEDSWIDSKGLVRRFAVSGQMSLSGTAMPLNVSEEFYDFGAHVSITVPPPSQVDATDGGAETPSPTAPTTTESLPASNPSGSAPSVPTPPPSLPAPPP